MRSDPRPLADRRLAPRGFIAALTLVAACSVELGTSSSVDEPASTVEALSTTTWNQVINGASAMCLNMGGQAVNNAAVSQWTCGTSQNLQWKLVSVATGVYHVVARNGGLCLNQAGSTTSGARVTQWTCGTSVNLQWTVSDLGGGFSKIVSRKSGMCLTDPSSSTARGTIMVQAPCTGATNQKWRLVDTAAPPPTACNTPGLVWKTARKTNYTSYPAPDSEECIKYNGCTWAGQFAACPAKEPPSWVQAHNIISVFPDFGQLKLHDLCLRSGTKTIVATVLDECADSDCSGCCTQNKGTAPELIDIESYTDARFGVPDGTIEWADLGPTTGQGCN